MIKNTIIGALTAVMLLFLFMYTSADIRLANERVDHAKEVAMLRAQKEIAEALYSDLFVQLTRGMGSQWGGIIFQPLTPEDTRKVFPRPLGKIDEIILTFKREID